METLPATTAPATPPPSTPPPPPDPPPGWGLAPRTAFRFAFVYWVLYSFALVAGMPFTLLYRALGVSGGINPDDPPAVVRVISVVGLPLGWVYQGLSWYTVWASKTFLGVDTSPPTDGGGSGDRLFMYCTAFAYLTLAVAAGMIWTAASELWARLRTGRRPGYDRLNALFRFVLRAHLLYQLVVYGAMKIWCNQFPPIQDAQLETKYGDSSPMGLLWRFMESSQPYTSASGVIETVCGLLLICRRTTLLGAVLSVGAMGQVFLLNMCYDVPVKLMSGHLLLMALTLVAQDWRRLTRFFVLAEPVPAAPLPALFVRWKWCHRVGLVLRTVLFVGYAGVTLEQWYAEARKTGILSTPKEYVGRWVGVAFERDGQAVPFPPQPDNPPLVPLPRTKWAGEPDVPAVIRARIGGGVVAFVLADQTYLGFVQTGGDDSRLDLMQQGNPQVTARLEVSHPEPDRMVLSGPFGQQQVKLTLKRVPEPPKREYYLRTKPFQWVQEFPDNR